jgi:peptide/nickel transport system substrate-binding protein
VSKAKASLALSGKTSASFTMLIASGSPLNTQIAQFIQAELQPVGITMSIKQETFATLLSDTDAHNYQAAFLGWSGRPDPDGNMYSYFHTGGGNNNMQYSNPQVDSYLEAAQATTNQAQRATDYQKAQQIMMQDAPYIFVYDGVSIQATTTNIKNFTLAPTGIMNFTNVYVGS